MRLLPNSSFTEESIYFCFKIKVLLKDFMCFFSQIATSLEGFVCVCSQITPLLQEFLHLMNHLVLHIPTCSHMSVHISTMVFSTILKPLWVVYLATTKKKLRDHCSLPRGCCNPESICTFMPCHWVHAQFATSWHCDCLRACHCDCVAHTTRECEPWVTQPSK